MDDPVRAAEKRLGLGAGAIGARRRHSGTEILVQLVMYCLGFLLAGLVGLYGGWVISWVWQWFLVPAGLPALTVKTAVGGLAILGSGCYGVSTLVSMVRQESGRDKSTGVEDVFMLAVMGFLSYTTLLVSAYVYQSIL